MIVIIDYGVGNLGSIQNMLYRIGAKSLVTNDPEQIQKAEKIILPGVGAFDAAIAKLEVTPIPGILKEKSKRGVPLLGICLGAQVLTQGSEEGKKPGLGILEAKCVKFNFADNSLKIPHMGWSELQVVTKHEVLNFEGLEEQARFYFAHSYHMVVDEQCLLGKSHYGYDFASAIFRKNTLAMQFHPEKSHYFGMRLLKNFDAWNP